MNFNRYTKYMAIVATAALAPYATTSAYALSCGHPTPSEHIEKTKIIFYGQVISFVPRERDDKPTIVEFDVLRAYKGVSSDTLRISYINDHGKFLGWGFTYKRPTLVFAQKVKLPGSPEVNIAVGYCTMIPYHARKKLHAKYWDALSALQQSP